MACHVLFTVTQDLTNSGVYYLCQVAGEMKEGLNAKLFQVRRFLFFSFFFMADMKDVKIESSSR